VVSVNSLANLSIPVVRSADVSQCGHERGDVNPKSSFHAYPVDAHDLASFSNASRKADGVAEASFFPSVGLFRSLPRWS
jgi:hypothetical protein